MNIAKPYSSFLKRGAGSSAFLVCIHFFALPLLCTQVPCRSRGRLRPGPRGQLSDRCPRSVCGQLGSIFCLVCFELLRSCLLLTLQTDLVFRALGPFVVHYRRSLLSDFTPGALTRSLGLPAPTFLCLRPESPVRPPPAGAQVWGWAVTPTGPGDPALQLLPGPSSFSEPPPPWRVPLGSTALGAGWRCRLTQGAFRGGVAPCCAPKGSGTELPGLSISWGQNPRGRRQSITYSYSWKVISTQWLSRKRAVSQSYRQAPRVPGCWGCVCILPRVPRSPFVKVPAE